jgi:hypothetical protein
MARPALVAVQPSVRPGVPPGTVGVVQPGFWDIATYVYDSISFASLISTIVAAIGSVASATGLGWLAPLMIPAVGAAIQGWLSNRAENLVGPAMRQKDLSVLSALIAAVVGGVGIFVASGFVTAAAVTTGIVSLIMLILEYVRVQGLERETIYGLVWSKIKPLCTRAEATPLLGS